LQRTPGFRRRQDGVVAMDNDTASVRTMRDAIDAVTRYASRGCSGMACDRARGAWMGHQLHIIGMAAADTTDEVRRAYPGLPWDRLEALADSQRGVAAMSADEMQRFVDQELPRVKTILMERLKRKD
jgi:uncharacterized protein with HEPN domain